MSPKNVIPILTSHIRPINKEDFDLFMSHKGEGWRVGKKFIGIAVKRGHSREDAKDVIQCYLLQLHKWLERNVATELDIHEGCLIFRGLRALARVSARRREFLPLDEDLLEDRYHSDMTDFLRRQLDRAIQSLPEDAQRLLDRVVLQGEKQKSFADLTGVPPYKICRELKKVVGLLRRLFDQG